MDVADATSVPVGHAVQSVEQKDGALLQFASAAAVKQYVYCPQTVLHDPNSQMPMSGIVVDAESEDEGDADGETEGDADGETEGDTDGEAVAIAVGEDVAGSQLVQPPHKAKPQVYELHHDAQ